MANIYDLKNKKILVTGALGQLGRTMVIELLQAGAKVIAVDTAVLVSPELTSILSKEKLKGLIYEQIDIRSKASIEKVAKNVGHIDVLVNNAGVSVFTPFEKRTEEELDWVMDVNTKGTILCAQVFSQSMIKKKKGKIINIGSIYGVVPADKKIYGDSGRNNSEIYGATKASVIHATKYLAAYLGEYGVTVNSVSPGGVFNNQKEFFVKNYVRKTPLGRMANENDISQVIAFLSSSASDYITGQNLTVDGGFSLNQ